MPAHPSSPIEPDVRQELESLRFSTFDDAMAPVAPWDEIEAPVRNYRLVLRKRGHK
jgi:hypothetical protein